VRAVGDRETLQMHDKLLEERKASVDAAKRAQDNRSVLAGMKRQKQDAENLLAAEKEREEKETLMKTNEMQQK